MTEAICAAISGLCAIFAACMGKMAGDCVHRSERRSELRRRESLLSLEMMDATLKLSVVTANALTGGHNNGNVERAREASKAAAQEYEEFKRRVTAHELGK